MSSERPLITAALIVVIAIVEVFLLVSSQSAP
jgi:hypothetical protein